MKIFKTKKRGKTHMPYMDNENAERLVNTYADTILRISYMYLKETHDAEDICQNIFLKLLSNDIHFDSSSHEKAWIIRSSINACKDHLRTAFWKRATDLNEVPEIPAHDNPESELLDLILTLPKNYRVSIYLYYYEGYPINEIASILGKSENTVSAYLSRGRKKLKSLLECDSTKTSSELKGVSNNA